VKRKAGSTLSAFYIKNGLWNVKELSGLSEQKLFLSRLMADIIKSLE